MMSSILLCLKTKVPLKRSGGSQMNLTQNQTEFSVPVSRRPPEDAESCSWGSAAISSSLVALRKSHVIISSALLGVTMEFD